jgi:hypothetical protein
MWTDELFDEIQKGDKVCMKTMWVKLVRPRL